MEWKYFEKFEILKRFIIKLLGVVLMKLEQIMFIKQDKIENDTKP